MTRNQPANPSEGDLYKDPGSGVVLRATRFPDPFTVTDSPSWVAFGSDNPDLDWECLENLLPPGTPVRYHTCREELGLMALDEILVDVL